MGFVVFWKVGVKVYCQVSQILLTSRHGAERRDGLLSLKSTYSAPVQKTYLHSWLWAYKTGSISETVEDRAKVTINNGLYKIVHGL